MVATKETSALLNKKSSKQRSAEETIQFHVNDISFSEIENSGVFFDLLDMPVFIIDDNRNIIFSNRKAREFTGLGLAAILKRNFLDFCFDDKEKERAESVFSSFMSDPDAQAAELLLKGYNDPGTTFLLNISLLHDTKSPKNALLISCVDIQKKKELEKDLLLESEMLYSHFESIPYALVLSDSSGFITFWNKQATRFFGYSKDEMIGQHITCIIPSRYRKVHEGWSDLISIGKSPVVGHIVEVVGLRKDGSEFPIELAITTSRVKGNLFHGAIINDISKRKMTERLLSIARNKYRMMFEKSPLGIFHFDEDGVITQCNDNLVKILDVPPENVISELIGANIIESFDDDNSIRKSIKQVLAGIPSRYEDDFHSPFSGRIIPLKADFSPVISDDGKFMGGICVVEDFTERRAAEKALNKYAEDLAKANDELKSLDRMKDEFISNLRHELKTPLIPIKGYSELMYEGALGELNHKQKDAVKKMMVSSERLRRLLDSLLYVSITESGNIEYTFTPLRISEVIDAAIYDKSAELVSKGQEIENSIASDVPLINGDIDYLTGVFIHLMDNAIKFTQDSGKIKIDVTSGENREIHVMIADSGIGISEEALPEIFKRFYQVDGSSTRKYGGNGLGLYICKKIIEAHNGQIWAESKLGAGTTIHILLPAK